jgi:hypothetical protein
MITSLMTIALAGTVSLPSTAPLSHVSEPHLALRTGLQCNGCHVNRTGGGGRNDYGSVYGQTQLPIRVSEARTRPPEQWLSVGGDLRVLASGAFKDAKPRSSISIDEANLQVTARLVPDLLTLYLDETIGPSGAEAREAFALVDLAAGSAYVKAGKFLLPYGYRIPDDAEYIRSRTGFNYATPDMGVEAGLQKGRLSLAVAATNGTQGADEVDNGKQFLGTASLVWPAFRLGTSAATNDSDAGQRNVMGAFGGVKLGPLVALGEVDVIEDEIAGEETRQLTGYVEGNLLARQGVNFKATYGFLDPSRDIPENERVRGRFGVELFPVSGLRLSAFYLMLEDIPQIRSDLDRWNLQLYVHF